MGKSCLFAPVLLWLISQRAQGEKGVLAGNRATPPGRPVLRPPPEGTQWGVPIGGDVSERTVQHQASSQAPAVSPLGSLRPVAQPVLWREERPEVRLFCQVPGGEADAIEWKRDGESVRTDRPLPANLSILELLEVEAPHCGSYSCNASNARGWQESPLLRLPSTGVSVVLEESLQISVSALVFAGFCGWGIMFPVCQSPKLRIRGKAWRGLSLHVSGLACLASALALVAVGLWIYDQGLSAALILPILLLLYVATVTALVAATVAFHLDVLNQVTDKAGQRLLDFTTPGGVALVALTCGILVKRIRQLREKGCAEPADLTAAVTVTVGMSFLPYIAIVVLHCMDLRRQEVQERISRREDWKQASILLRKNLRAERPPSPADLPEAPMPQGGA